MAIGSGGGSRTDARRPKQVIRKAKKKPRQVTITFVLDKDDDGEIVDEITTTCNTWGYLPDVQIVDFEEL